MTTNKITYLDQLFENKFFAFSKVETSFLYFSDFTEIKQNLELLKQDTIYVCTFELYTSEFTYEDDLPCITLSKPILITKNSSSITISKFLLNRISLADERLDLNYEVLLQIRGKTNTAAPFIIMKYHPINLF
jgi:hypothetical protein